MKRLLLILLTASLLTLLVLMLWQLDTMGWIGRAITAFQEQQRQFHNSLATDLHAIHDTGSWLPAIALIGIGFLYGVFHAIGPGHGKLIVTSYMLANNSGLKRGLLIVVLSSLLQGIVAVALVLSAYYLLGLARAEAEHATAILEAVSFGLIALVGTGLFMRGLREATRLWNPPSAQQYICDHPSQDHVHDETCGHVHMPTPQAADAARGFWPLLLMIISVGIRPCSGAVILLLFACLIGVIVPGIIATMAMAAGTALTTGLLAIAAVQSKKFFLKTMQATDRGLAIVHAALGIGGGLLIALMGIFFLLAGLQLEAQRQAAAPPSVMPLMRLPPKPGQI